MPRNLSHRQKRFNRKRKSARKRWLHVLMRVNRFRCQKCGHFVVTYKSVAKRRANVVNKGHLLTWTTPWGKQAQCRLATVDHIQRVADGGDNSWSNLRLLCQSCNHEEAREIEGHIPRHATSTKVPLRQSLQLPLPEHLKRSP